MPHAARRLVWPSARPHPVGVTIAAKTATLATSLLVVTAALAGCSSDGSDDQTPSAQDSPAASASQSPSPSPTDAGSPSAEPTRGTTTVPIYWVGDTPQGPRLYREFRRVSGTPLQAAADLLTDGKPLSPRYRTLFPGGTFASVAIQDGVIVATARDEAWQTPGRLSEAQGELAVQSLVYTLQGTARRRLPVEVRVEGSDEADFLFGYDTAGGVKAADQLSTLSPVSITTPETGAVVSGGSLKASGVANSPEGNVPWTVQDAAGKTVLDGFATADGAMDALYPWSTTIDVSSLSPGSYAFVARTDDAESAAKNAQDYRTFTVR